MSKWLETGEEEEEMRVVNWLEEGDKPGERELVREIITHLEPE